MNPRKQFPDAISHFASPAIGITIIYEDLATGLRAKRFSDMLIASLGAEYASRPACWRIELIDLPEVAVQIARDAAASEFVIFSLRGNTSLSIATRVWIEAWLASADSESASLVALFDPERIRRGPAEGVRYYLRHAAAEASVAFFAHCVLAPCKAAIDLPMSDKRAAITKRRQYPQNRIVKFFP